MQQLQQQTGNSAPVESGHGWGEDDAGGRRSEEAGADQAGEKVVIQDSSHHWGDEEGASDIPVHCETWVITCFFIR